MNFEYNEKELLHSNILEKVTVECRSNKFGFKEGKTDKLDNIREILQNSGYHEILLSNAQIWRRDFSSPIDVVVSSHSDVVDSITKCSSRLSEEGYYSGTYDNAGTNAAAVIAMLEGDLPSNIVFAFTADEETGRCNGAMQVLEYVRNLGNDPTFIALDVTYEGYEDGLIFTVENLSSGHKKNEDMNFLNQVGNAAMALENGNLRTCSFVRLHKEAIPEVFPKEYISKDSGWFDEGQAYAKEHARAFSLCLPCEGNMHGNSGVRVRQPEFEGYVNALEAISYSLVNENLQYVENKKNENAILCEKLLEMVKEEEQKRLEEQASRKSYSSYSGYNRYAWRGMSDEEADYYSYNSSYGVYDNADEYFIGGSYSLADFPSYDDYISAVVDDIYDAAYSYDIDEENVTSFIEELIDYTSLEVIEYFGGEDKYSHLLCNLIETEFGYKANEDEIEIRRDRSLRYDEDGYEYDENLVSMFLTPEEQVKNLISILERNEQLFTSEQKCLLLDYARETEDGDKAVEKVRLLAHVIETSPHLVSKEMSRIHDELDLISLYKDDTEKEHINKASLNSVDYIPYEDFDDDFGYDD